jgi:hypothetical protein
MEEPQHILLTKVGCARASCMNEATVRGPAIYRGISEKLFSPFFSHFNLYAGSKVVLQGVGAADHVH